MTKACGIYTISDMWEDNKVLATYSREKVKSPASVNYG